MDIVGQKVLHSKFGIGTIIWFGGRPQNNSTYIKVEFEGKILELVFPACFEKILKVFDEDFSEKIQRELDKLKKLKENENKNFSSISTSQHKTIKQNHKSISYSSINTFKFYNKKIKYRGKIGFETYDSTNRIVGITFMNDDERKPSYGQAEICFYEEYKTELGEWRLVSIEKVRLSFKRLSQILDEQGSFTVTIDPRKGS